MLCIQHSSIYQVYMSCYLPHSTNLFGNYSPDQSSANNTRDNILKLPFLNIKASRGRPIRNINRWWTQTRL